MVRAGCRGIALLAKSHPESAITVLCPSEWVAFVRNELPEMEVLNEPAV